MARVCPRIVRALSYRAKELDLNLPLLESIMASNDQHLERAVEMVLATGKKKVAMLGSKLQSRRLTICARALRCNW